MVNEFTRKKCAEVRNERPERTLTAIRQTDAVLSGSSSKRRAPPDEHLAKIALLLVVLVDIMGQGLLYPILTTLMLDPNQPFLPAEHAAIRAQPRLRSCDRGDSSSPGFWARPMFRKLSDMIGAQEGHPDLPCGRLLGNGLTIVSLCTNSCWLLLIGRVVTGFTNGNQPIAAGRHDRPEHERRREDAQSRPYIVAAASIGLVAGPILSGVLSDPAVLGSYAIAETAILRRARSDRGDDACSSPCFSATSVRTKRPLRIEPLEIFLVLWRALERPAIRRISLVFFCFMFFLNDVPRVHGQLPDRSLRLRHAHEQPWP